MPPSHAPADSPKPNQQQGWTGPLLVPTLQVGFVSGATGSFVGAIAGILRSETPALFSLVAGAQWFALGSSYYATRQLVAQAWNQGRPLDPPAKVKVSALSGGVAGFVGGVLRGPRNILPGMMVFSVVGAGGQAVANAVSPAATTLDASHSGQSWLHSKWSPLTPLTDEQYEALLQEKILQLDAEIALVDVDIALLRGGIKKSR